MPVPDALPGVRTGVQFVVAYLRVDDLNLSRFNPHLAENIRAPGMHRARLLIDRAFFNEACLVGLKKTWYRWITPCRNTESVERALADFAKTGKRTGVVPMATMGRDGRQTRYWMRIEPRRKGEDGAGGGDGCKPLVARG